MKIGSLAPWYGGKRTLAPHIIRQLGKHSAYWEPFCGSCSVLFAKPRATYETVNDLHEDLINLALVVANPLQAERLYGMVSRTLYHEDLLRMAKDLLTNWQGGDSVERAYWYLVFSWMGLNGTSGQPLSHIGGSFAIRYSTKGGNGATRWSSVCDSIPDWHQRLVGVQILSRDAFEVIGRIDDAAGTAIYCDPPYIAKGGKYVHDFAAEDHARLAAALRRFTKARVVVSYYEHPLLADLYAGWGKLDSSYLRIAKSMVNGGMRDETGRTEAPEILLVNGDIYHEGELFS